jgi:DnaJ-class molecular chaperone
MEDYDDDLAAYMSDDSEPSDTGICPACSGSGEGQFEGTTCHQCKGDGEV